MRCFDSAALTLVGSVLGLCACTPNLRGDGLFPLAEGRRWDYAVTVTHEETTEPPQRDRLTFHNRGAEEIKGEVAWRRRSASGIDYWLRSDETGIYRVASKTDLQYGPQPDAERRYVLKQPMAVGTTWEADTTVYVLQRRNEFAQTQYTRNKSIKMIYSVVAVGEKLSTAGGVAFHGDIKGWFKALDAKTGKTLWKFNAGSGISAAPMTYVLDGKQYVAVVSGRTFSIPAFFGALGERMVAASPEGGTLYVFALN